MMNTTAAAANTEIPEVAKEVLGSLSVDALRAEVLRRDKEAKEAARATANKTKVAAIRELLNKDAAAAAAVAEGKTAEAPLTEVEQAVVDGLVASYVKLIAVKSAPEGTRRKPGPKSAAEKAALAAAAANAPAADDKPSEEQAPAPETPAEA